LKVYCAYYNDGKNVKITKTIDIVVTKHPAEFGIKKLERRKVMTVLVSPGPRKHFCLSTPSENPPIAK